jgi:hypothetical protein
MGLQDERDTFDGGGIGTFAALGEALLDQALWVGEERDALAGVAFAASIVGEALAVCGLRKEPGESELADAMRAGEEKCMRYPSGTQGSAECGDDLLIAAKFGESHGYGFS